MSAFFGSVRMRTQRVLVESVEHGADHRQPADELRDQAELEQVLGLHVLEQGGALLVRNAPPRWSRRRRVKPTTCLPMRRSMILSRPTNAPPQMNRMLVVLTWMNSWCGCLRPPWGGTLQTVPSRIFSSACCTPSPETSRVIEAFSRLAGDLVDLVDVDDAALGALDVVVGVLQEPQHDVLDVLADVAGLGQRRGVGDGEGHVEDPRQRLREQRLAGAGRARAAGCCSSRARRRPSGRGPGGPVAGACSGCRRRRRGPSWRGPGRSRSRRGCLDLGRLEQVSEAAPRLLSTALPRSMMSCRRRRTSRRCRPRARR